MQDYQLVLVSLNSFWGFLRWGIAILFIVLAILVIHNQRGKSGEKTGWKMLIATLILTPLLIFSLIKIDRPADAPTIDNEVSVDDIPVPNTNANDSTTTTDSTNPDSGEQSSEGTNGHQGSSVPSNSSNHSGSNTPSTPDTPVTPDTPDQPDQPDEPVEYTVTINHFKKTIDGSYNEIPDEQDTIAGHTGDVISPETKTYTGFKSPETQTITLENNNVTISYRYERNTTTIVFDPDYEAAEGEMADIVVPYEATIIIPSSGYTMDGYLPDYWEAYDEDDEWYDDYNFGDEFTAESEETTLYFYLIWERKASTISNSNGSVNIKISATLNGATNFGKYNGTPNFDEIDGEVDIRTGGNTPTYIWKDGENAYWWSEVTPSITNARNMFGGAEIANIDLSGFKTTDTTDMSYMFAESKVTSVNFGDFNTAKVTTMTEMFSNSTISSIDFGTKFNTGKVKNMSKMFAFDASEAGESSRLTSIDLSSFDLSSVTTMANMFNGCSNLQQVTFGNNVDTSKVQSMAGMFRGTSSLSAIDLSKFTTPALTNMNSMFRDSGVTTLDLSTFDVDGVKNFGSLLHNAMNLTTVDFSGWIITRSILDLNGTAGMFSQNSSLTTIYVDDNSDFSGLERNDLLFSTMSTNLVGGNGTIWSGNDSSVWTNVYARVDDPIHDQPGWFTLKNPDTVTFDAGEGSASYNSYNYIPGTTYGAFPTVTPPQGKKFVNWSTSNENNFPVTESMTAESGTIYAWYKDLEANARLRAGAIAEAYQALSYDGTSYPTSFSRSDTAPSCSQTTCISMESNDSDHEIIGFRTRDAFYYYTTGAKVFLPVNSSDLFYFDSDNPNTALTSIDMSGFDASEVQTMDSAFRALTKLTSLNLSMLDTSNVTNMNTMFDQDRSLTSLTLGGSFTTENVVYMNGFLAWCTNLSSFDASQIDTSSATSLGGMFSYSGITSLDLSGWDVSNVETISGIFSGMNDLTTVNMSGWGESKITNLSGLFGWLPSLVEVDLAGFDTSNVTNMSSMFEHSYGESVLTTIYVDESFSTESVTNDNRMFFATTNLVGGEGTAFATDAHEDSSYARIDNPDGGAPGYLTLRTATIEYASDFTTAFSSGALKSITCSAALPDNCPSSSCRDISSSNSQTPLYAWQVDDKGYYYTKASKIIAPVNMKNMFAFFSVLETTDIFQYLDVSNTTSMEGLFRNSTKLTTIDLSTWKTESLVTTDNMFSSASSLERVVFGAGFDTSKVTSMKYMFSGTDSLSEIDLSQIETQSVTGDGFTGMFNATGLERIDLSSFSTAGGPTSLSVLFSYSPNVKYISLAGWDLSGVTRINQLFSGLTSLEEIDFSVVNAKNVTDISAMFKGCTSLKTIYVTENPFDLDKITSSNEVFYNTPQLKGGDGTTWSSENANFKRYARIDDHANNVWAYFTKKSE